MIKKNRHLLRSLKILGPQCYLWLEQNGCQNIHAPDSGVTTDTKSKNFKVIDIVLMGTFLNVFFRSKKIREWKGRYRIWVLSKTIERACIEILGIPQDRIGIIPRYDLFPVTKRRRPFPDLTHPWTLYYSGRTMIEKNIKLSAAVCFFLQKQFKHQVKFVARLDDVDSHYARSLEKWINDLPWDIPPLIQMWTPAQTWVNDITEPRPVLINLSQFVNEDFGVAVAQAQAQGWPLILSDWGGHQDVQGQNVLKIPSFLLGNSFESNEIILARAECIATYLVKHWKKKNRTPPSHFKKPKYGPHSELQKALSNRLNIQKTYWQFQNILQGDRFTFPHHDRFENLLIVPQKVASKKDFHREVQKLFQLQFTKKMEILVYESKTNRAPILNTFRLFKSTSKGIIFWRGMSGFKKPKNSLEKKILNSLIPRKSI